MAMKTDMYETSDIALASYLFCSGVSLNAINRRNPQRCVFVFQNPKADIISKWQEGRANVNALAFYNAYQTLKTRLFSHEY